MFGLLRAPACTLGRSARADWAAHLCGLCLTLRDRVGQSARLTTNFDAALVSALYSAQASACPDSTPRRTQVCPLRGFRRAEVVDSSSPGARLAAATATAMAAVKLDDTVDDGGRWLGRSGWLLRPVARSAAATARGEAEGLDLDLAPVFAQARRQAAVEGIAGRPFTWYSGPTEQAAGEVFAQTGRLAGRPWNGEPLRRLGRMFGRLVYLMDAVRDLEDDRRAGHFNPLAERPDDPVRRAARLARRSRAVIAGLLPRLDLARPELVTALLTGGLRAACRRTLLAAGAGQALVAERDRVAPDDADRVSPEPIVPGYGDTDEESESRKNRWPSCCDVFCCVDCCCFEVDCTDCCCDCGGDCCDCN